MTNKYLLKYRTFDELLADAQMDLKKYAVNGMIDPAPLIKIAQLINKRLGNKLRPQKEAILYVEKGYVRLPEDFHLLTNAFMCYGYSVTNKVVSGDQREYRSVETVIPVDGCEPVCPTPCVRLTECGKAYEIIQTTAFETRHYKNIGKLSLYGSNSIMPGCKHLLESATDNAYIENKFLYTSFDEGTVYISYLGNMENEEGELIVLDHEMINEYYVYSLKRRIIENLLINGETIPQGVIQIIDARYKEAKVEGESLVNMPDYADLEAASQLNRKQKYSKYYKMFE